MKKRRDAHNSHIHIRLSEKDKRRIEWLAKTYAGGNISKWINYAALNAERKFLEPDTEK